MERPPKPIMTDPKPSSTVPAAPTKPFVDPVSKTPKFDVTFRIRRLDSGNFRGLYELTALRLVGGHGEPGKPARMVYETKQVICDADLLPSCLENLGQIFENMGL